MGRVSAWLGERIPITGDQLRELTNEPVPNHLKRWWFALGGTPAYLFVVQIVTGILLAFYYQPSRETAYESVRYITDQAAFGWYLRGVHKWGATLMVAAVVLHQMRVFFTAAYRKPREINWIVGMGLLLLTLMTAFTGYSLVYEQLSYWGVTVGANLADSIPWVGGFIKKMMFGGDGYTDVTLSRFFILHAAVLPGTIVLMIGIHIALIRMQGVTELKFKSDTPEKRHFKFIPDHLYTELIIGLTLMVVLSALAVVFPAHMGPLADPLTTPEVIKPEWYFYVVFRWLKLFSGGAAILSIGFVLFVMVAWPFIDATIVRLTKKKEISTYIGVLGAIAIIVLTVWEAVVAH